MRSLHIASPLMRGTDVHGVQTDLSRKGYHPGPIDGRYGPSTMHAVKSFQRDHGITVDGIVGPRTWAKLEAQAGKPRPAPLPVDPRSPGVLALHESIKHLGVTEIPRGSNRNIFGRWFGVDGVAWCNIFVSYCFSIGARYTICKNFRGAGVYAKGCTYVPTTEAWLRATGQWIGRAQPKPGDIAIYNWDGGVPDHIGIVEKYLGGGKFQAIEGNTAIGNDSNGGEVMRRVRYLTQVDGFGRVR